MAAVIAAPGSVDATTRCCWCWSVGLRAGEVATLGLDDIDWRAGEIVVRGKGDHVERLPLPVDVGEAIAGYLRRGRPAMAWTARCSYGSGTAPRPADQRAVSGCRQRRGPRRSEGVRRRPPAPPHDGDVDVAAGATLAEVGQVLRHRRLMTTAIYAKVDRDGLRLVALRGRGARREPAA